MFMPFKDILERWIQMERLVGFAAIWRDLRTKNQSEEIIKLSGV